ncbi:MAG: hypothetical protein AB7O88_09225 [Reyranellaceae bacterium]
MDTERRVQIIRNIVPQVVPSTYGEAKFKRIDSTWKPGDAYTTCGGLPGFVAGELGVSAEVRREGIAGSGLASMRDAAIKRGAWVHHSMLNRRLAGAMNLEGDMKRPKPGDFYMLCSGDEKRHEEFCNCLTPEKGKIYRGATIEHVGIIVSAEGTLWKTADAGQPGGQTMVNGVAKTIQAAKYCDRKFDPATGLLVGEFDGKGGRPMRRLCGWMDVDKFPFLKYPG